MGSARRGVRGVLPHRCPDFEKMLVQLRDRAYQVLFLDPARRILCASPCRIHDSASSSEAEPMDPRRGDHWGSQTKQGAISTAHIAEARCWVVEANTRTGALNCIPFTAWRRFHGRGAAGDGDAAGARLQPELPAGRFPRHARSGSTDFPPSSEPGIRRLRSSRYVRYRLRYRSKRHSRSNLSRQTSISVIGFLGVTKSNMSLHASFD